MGGSVLRRRREVSNRNPERRRRLFGRRRSRDPEFLAGAGRGAGTHGEARPCRAGVTAPLTVAACLDNYIEFLEANRKSGREASYAADALILPTLGKTKVADLTTEQVGNGTKAWPRKTAGYGARKGNAQQYGTTKPIRNGSGGARVPPTGC